MFPSRQKLKRVFAALLGTGIIGMLALVIAIFAVPLPERMLMRDSVVVEYHDGSTAHVSLSQDEKWRISADLDEVDPDYVDALIRLEDKRFWLHPGVDVVALTRAIFQNITSGRRVSGASTITMQVARLVEPRPRTYVSKAIEAFRAVQFEAHYSKEEILEMYLRFTPYGSNIEGIEAASLSYFGHRATELSADEIATLLAVPQAPNTRYPIKRNQARLTDARNDIAQRLLDEGKMPRGEDEAKLSETEVHKLIVESYVPDGIKPFPREMKHFAMWAMAKKPKAQRIRTTIDRGIQATAEESLRRHQPDATDASINHATLVVADHRNHRILAAVGNFEFSTLDGSQIPAFDVVRSPGSLLKPFIYAMSVQRGLALPSTLVQDIPMRSGTYTPVNYDGEFSGLVRLNEALSRSLNIPFIKLLQDLGVNEFLNVLSSMGARHINPEPGYYGLTAAIGGVSTTPLEIASMYATLANSGWYKPLQWERDKAPHEGWKVFEPGTAWLTQQALYLKDRPDFNSRRRINPDAGRVYWKTGTSFGNRDAWAAGSGEHYTAVVWMGNLDNERSSALIGSQRSGPVLFDILEAIEHPHEVRPGRSSDLVEVEVCSYSGHLPTDACTHRKKVWALQKSVPTARCPYHQLMAVDTKTGEALAPHCQHGRDFTQQSVVIWPASVRRYLSEEHRRGYDPPAWAPGCRADRHNGPPSIVSPPYGQDLVLMPGIDIDQQEVPLEANTEDGTQTLSWFVNGALLGEAPAHKRLWWTPRRGEHEIVVQDEAGRSTRRKVRVR